MKFSILFLFILLLLPFRVAFPSEKIVKDSIVSHNKKRTFYLFVPGSVRAAEPAPLIVLLHGSGRNGLSLVEKWKELAVKEGVILVGPDAEDSSGWSVPGDGPDFLHELVEMLKSKFPINPRRVYLFGHSAGAVFAINLSMMESEYFAATAIHAGAWREPGDFQALNYAKRKIPLAIWVGTLDQYFPLQAVRATRDALSARGFPVELTEMEGHDHWYYDLAPQINRNAWEFLKKHELGQDQKYAQYGDAQETTGANQLIEEINALRIKANEVSKLFNEREAELKIRDFNRDRAEVKRIAQEELDLLKQSAAIWLEAAGKAERASQLNVSDKYRRYLSLVGQQNRKQAELSDTLREQTEAMLSDASFEVISAKRSETQKRVGKLQQEIDELQQEAEKIMK